MGGTQSGPRVLTIETGQGATDVTISEDFVNYVTDQETSNGSNDLGKDETMIDPAPRAQDVLRGTSSDGDSKLQALYEQERMKNKEYKKLTDEEFESAASRVKIQFSESQVGQLIPVCEEQKEAVLFCYSHNAKSTLKCLSEVKEYAQCVKKARKGLLVQTLPH
ncbi:PREDICTED: MICOS complex subunit mic25a-like [Amphimedon queenslandica]|uniref:CHCH domain-containing protein n=1 Tax=Amphimedon queenslandica TaxID=400682 RepID=A0A1X7VLV3_AMPQE|nr:PREDICTED: MICOS complex subunit mic25a-like [Amphimedon queenslandica]|eukprot:XP_019864488.1 PREDICTED: MICOS complex subunit mic25a-like [Amphimedon queenslandica]